MALPLQASHPSVLNAVRNAIRTRVRDEVALQHQLRFMRLSPSPGVVTSPALRLPSRDPRSTSLEPAARDGAAPAAVAPGALAFKLYLIFVVSWFLHMPARVSLLAAARADFLLVLLISGLIIKDGCLSTSVRDSRISRLMLALVGYAIAVVPFVEWPGSVLKNGVPELIKALIFFYFTASLTTTERRLRSLLAVFVLCQTFRALEPLWLHVSQGYWGSAASMLGGAEFMNRLSGAPSDVVNPNGLAFVILSVIPFAHYLWPQTRLGGLAYAVTLPALLYTLVLTGSRSGMVSLVLVFAIIWLQSRRKLLLLLPVLPMLWAGATIMSPEQVDRYSSIIDTDTKNRETANERVTGVIEDFRVAMRRPWLGHGLGTSKEANVHYSGRLVPAHNLLTEALQELGFVGLTIFLALLVSIARRVAQCLARFSQSSGTSPLLLRLMQAVRVWFAMTVVFSFFSYGLASYEWYFMAGLAEVAMALSGTFATGRQTRSPVWVDRAVMPPRAAAGATRRQITRARI